MFNLKDIAELGIGLNEARNGNMYELPEFQAANDKIFAAREGIEKALGQTASDTEVYSLTNALDCAHGEQCGEIERMYYKIGFADAMRLLIQSLIWEPNRGK